MPVLVCSAFFGLITGRCYSFCAMLSLFVSFASDFASVSSSFPSFLIRICVSLVSATHRPPTHRTLCVASTFSPHFATLCGLYASPSISPVSVNLQPFSVSFIPFVSSLSVLSLVRHHKLPCFPHALRSTHPRWVHFFVCGVVLYCEPMRRAAHSTQQSPCFILRLFGVHIRCPSRSADAEPFSDIVCHSLLPVLFCRCLFLPSMSFSL